MNVCVCLYVIACFHVQNLSAKPVLNGECPLVKGMSYFSNGLASLIESSGSKW